MAHEAPPYPGEWSTAGTLYHRLTELHGWLAAVRPQLGAAGTQVPAARELPTRSNYTGQALITQWSHLVFLRRLRENWDHLDRLDPRWEEPGVVRQRAALAQVAAVMLNSAFVSSEAAEARSLVDADQRSRWFTRILDDLFKSLEPATYQLGPEDSPAPEAP